MDIILAFEGVRVLGLVINTLDLDGRVVDVVLPTAHVCHGGQRLQWLYTLNMDRH